MVVVMVCCAVNPQCPVCVPWQAPDSLPDKLSRNGTCVHAQHRCLDTASVTAVPLGAPADADGDGVESMSSAGRTTAGGCDAVALGTLTRSPAAQQSTRPDDRCHYRTNPMAGLVFGGVGG